MNPLREVAEDLVQQAEPDMVNHPPHYNQGKIEVIEFIEDVLKANFVDYVVGNVIKYVSRHRYKNGLQDLKKARWYLDRAIKYLEVQNDQSSSK